MVRVLKLAFRTSELQGLHVRVAFDEVLQVSDEQFTHTKLRDVDI